MREVELAQHDRIDSKYRDQSLFYLHVIGSDMKHSVLAPPVPLECQLKTRWSYLPGGSLTLAISALVNRLTSPVLLVTSSQRAAYECFRELRFFCEEETDILLFPDWETLPYDHFSPQKDLISERLSVLSRLPSFQAGIIIASAATLAHRLAPCQSIEPHLFSLSVGEQMDAKEFQHRLVRSMYHCSRQVISHGEFTVRGSMIDLFPMGAREPFRIEFFDNKIDSIRIFDPETQRSKRKVEHMRVLPAHEIPLTKSGIECFRVNWRAQFPGNPLDSPVYQAVSKGEAPQGIEYYLPLFFKSKVTATFFDYLPKATTIFRFEGIESKINAFWKEIEKRYEQGRYDIRRPLLEPRDNFLSTTALFRKFNNYQQIILNDPNPHVVFDVDSPTQYSINHRDRVPLEPLRDFLNHFEGRTLFCAESLGRREVLLDLMQSIHLTPKIYANWKDFLTGTSGVGMVVGSAIHSVLLNKPRLALITESQLFNDHVSQHYSRQSKVINPDTLIRHLTELNIGAPVVHSQHGVGRYRGLQCLSAGEVETEYLTIEYAEGDKVYVPITSLNLITRYTGADSDHAPLQKLGTRQWEKTKEKARRQIHDTAAELLDLYSRRQATQGFAFLKPDKNFVAFRAAFPFEETPDQTKAINEIIEDMTKSQPMDRLVCGDVGFGKTEIAMQSAFLAIQSHKQVAVLVPTTLLAAQHFKNFSDRFADWPVCVDILTRVQTPKEQKQVLRSLSEGKTDIIIGTHKLLNSEVRFKDLRLLIVDEEHRFGVRQKEKIKSMRACIDMLALTATPIPRTLNMSLVSIRDLSIMATPPQRRLSIKTFIHEESDSLVREAILRESMRGGQVYYLYNDVSTMQTALDRLNRIAPESRIAMAHGQMNERELERVMSAFYHQHYNILVCSTIIESGIDVPNANTIIIHRADKFGLAQLHQLRGRVGRSHHQAYAYLTIPPQGVMTRDAKKRLDAIAHLGDLGAGFMLANHDLEIRGAGNLLGEEQSGQIHAIGFSLYMDLLSSSVEVLREGGDPMLREVSLGLGTEIDLQTSALIPEDYIVDVQVRLMFYKRLSSCKTDQALQQLKIEIVDRFGELPTLAQHLFDITHLKIKTLPLGIKKIDVGKSSGYIQFLDNPKINPTKIVHLVQSDPAHYQLHGGNTLKFKAISESFKEKIIIVENILLKLI